MERRHAATIENTRLVHWHDERRALHGLWDEVVPIGFAVHVSWPGGGFTWHRPVAVEVRHGDDVRRLAIHDVTLEAIVSIVMTGIAIVILSTSWKRWIHIKRRNIS